MKKIDFKPKVTVVLQISAGQPLDALQDKEGRVYIEYPMPFNSSDAKVEDVKTVSEEVKPKTGKKSAPPKKEKAEKEDAEESYTEKELMETPVKELIEICEENDIAIPKEGKNTNKKLRLLILAAQEEEEEEAPAPKKGKGKKSSKVEEEEEDDEEMSDEDRSELIKLLEEYDEGDIDDKELKKALKKMGFAKGDVKEIIEGLDDTELSIEDYVDSLTEEEDEEDEEEEEEDDDDTIDISDLKVKNKVNVYFDDEDEWFEGVVTSTKRGKVIVKFEDDSSETLSPKKNSKVVKL